MICGDTSTYGPWMGGSVGQWVGSGHFTACYRFYGWVYGSMGGISDLILELINLI